METLASKSSSSVFCPCSIVQGFTEGVASAKQTLQNRADVDT